MEHTNDSAFITAVRSDLDKLTTGAEILGYHTAIIDALKVLRDFNATQDAYDAVAELFLKR